MSAHHKDSPSHHSGLSDRIRASLAVAPATAKELSAQRGVGIKTVTNILGQLVCRSKHVHAIHDHYPRRYALTAEGRGQLPSVKPETSPGPYSYAAHRVPEEVKPLKSRLFDHMKLCELTRQGIP